jgi:hypothetical protein PPSC2_c4905
MNDSYPLFTVIIPEKNRAEYLIHTLKTCMIQEYPNFEVIVSDDCSIDDSAAVALAAAEKDPRIKVFTHDHHLGMRDNFEFALSKVRPGYVMALGGDDGLVVGCIQRMYEILKETGRQLLTWVPAGYEYPSRKGDDSIFYVRRKHSPIEIRKSEKFLKTLADTFNYQMLGCPMFYIYGVASTELVDRVKSRTKDNSFYYCPTPDGFSGVVLSGEVDDYVMCYEPLSIGGSTIKSQGLNYKRTDEKSRKEAEEFFNDNVRRTMHSQLASQPYSPLVTLMTADYLLTAKELPGWPGKVPEISFKKLLIRSFEFIRDSSYDVSVLPRELKILREIAKQHNLLTLYNSLLKNTKKKILSNQSVKGFAITNSMRFSGRDVGVNNIYDACLATNFVYKFFGKFSAMKCAEVVRNDIKIIVDKYGPHRKLSLPHPEED